MNTEFSPFLPEERAAIVKDHFSELITYSEWLRKTCAWCCLSAAVLVFLGWHAAECAFGKIGEASEFEFHSVFLGMLALTTAGALVILMVRILASVENVGADQSIDNTKWNKPTNEDLKFEKSKILRYQILGCVVGAILSFLFTANQTVWDSVVLDKWVLGVSLGLAGFGGHAVSWVMRRELRRRQELQDVFGESAHYRWSRPRIAAFEKSFAIVGIIFALYSGKLATITLTRSARANVAASRGQLYQTEARLTEREGQKLDLAGLYVRPKINAKFEDIALRDQGFWLKRAQEYWRDRLVATLEPLEREITESIYRNPLLEAELGVQVTKDQEDPGNLQKWNEVREQVHVRILALVDLRCPDVASLYAFIYCDNSEILKTETFVERRCRDCLMLMLTHVVDILDLMHAAFDYRDEQILRANEFETWVGYLGDVGAHPILLLVTKNWLDQRYFSAEFFAELNHRFMPKIETDEPSEKQVALFVQKVAWDKYLRQDFSKEYPKLIEGLRSYRTEYFQHIRVPPRPTRPTNSNELKFGRAK